MKFQSLIVMLLALVFAAPAFGQKRERKMQEAIDSLNTTEFVRKYKEYKELVEMTISNFKAVSSNYEIADVQEVQYGFKTTASNFNKILETIKKDLLDKKTREFIKTSPDRYTQFVAQELDLAYKGFQQTVVLKITELTGEQPVGIGVMEIKLLLDLVFDVVGVINSIEGELSRMNDAYVEEKFVAPLRVKTWEAL